jgi:hypothetical protein
MADTDTYQPDSAGASALADAKQKTADVANQQKQAQAKGAEDAGKATQQASAMKTEKQDTASGDVAGAASARQTVLGSFKKGGEVPETGVYKLHEGEEVVPNNGRASAYRKVFKSRGDSGKHSWGGK